MKIQFEMESEDLVQIDKHLKVSRADYHKFMLGECKNRYCLNILNARKILKLSNSDKDCVE